MSVKSLKLLARLGGLGPPTCGLEVRCSIQLSYRRIGMKSIQYLFIEITSFLHMIYLTKYFRYQDTKLTYNKQFFFVS